MAKARSQPENLGEQPVQFRHRDAQRIANAVAAHEARRRDRKPSELPRASGGGGGGLTLGKVTAAWNKNTLRQVIVHDQGNALFESTSAPPAFVNGVVNKFANVEADKWVMIGEANGRWYLVSAEC
jgi:hypothetical protein